MVFYSWQTDSVLTLGATGYTTTITVDAFGGCGEDSVVVTLYGIPIGGAVVRTKSPDQIFADSTGSWGVVSSHDFTIFGNHYQSSPCECDPLYPNPYDECSNFVTANADTMIYTKDFTMFGNHWNHEYMPGGSGSSPNVVYSSGSVEVTFEENDPLQGTRKLRAHIALVGGEPFQSAIIAFRNENPILEYAGWFPSGSYQRPTMAAEIRRSGQDEILLGVMGSKTATGGLLELGYVELKVLSADPLEIAADDLALVDAEVLTLDGTALAASGSNVLRAVERPVYTNQLAQNYPNPFNPSTTIAYSIASSSLVWLQVFNVRGQLVRSLVDERKTAGNHRAVWDGLDDRGNGVASGVYFYRLATESFSSTKKMVLVR